MNTNYSAVPADLDWRLPDANEPDTLEKVMAISAKRQELLNRVKRFASDPSLGHFKLMSDQDIATTAAITKRIDQGDSRFNFLKPLVEPVGNGWLNNEIVNEYLSLLQKTAPDTIRHQSSFFMTAIEEYGLRHVDRWNRSIHNSFFQEGTFVIPYNKNKHWTLLVGRTLLIDGEYDVSVCHYDSSGGKNLTASKTLSAWFERELKSRELRLGQVSLEHRTCPRQQNGSDCGVFTLINAKDVYCGQEPHTLQAANTPYARLELVLDLGKSLLNR